MNQRIEPVLARCAAPEVISARTHYDGTKADIWSCGVMLYVMLFCEYPFERPEDDADKYGFQKARFPPAAFSLACPQPDPLSSAFPPPVMLGILHFSVAKVWCRRYGAELLGGRLCSSMHRLIA